MEADLSEQVLEPTTLPLFLCSKGLTTKKISANGHSENTVNNGPNNTTAKKVSPSANDMNGYHDHHTTKKQPLPSPKALPKDPSLSASEQEIETLFTEEYWRKLCPQLHVNDEAMRRLIESAGVFAPDTKKLDQFRAEVKHFSIQSRTHMKLNALI